MYAVGYISMAYRSGSSGREIPSIQLEDPSIQLNHI